MICESQQREKMNAVDFEEMHNGIVYKMIENEQEAEQALKLMLTVYFKDAPVPRFLGSDDVSNAKMVRNLIKEGFSGIAVLVETGEVVGAKIVQCIGRDRIENERLHSSVFSVRIEAKYCEQMDDLDTLFKIFPEIHKICSSYASVVHPSVRSRGIGKIMNACFLKVAKKCGFKLLNTIAGSPFSRRIFDGLGYKVYKRVLWDEMEIEGEKVFKGQDMGSPECTSHYYTL